MSGSDNASDVGRVAFETYREIRSGLTHDGKDMPLWDQLNDDIKSAWTDAVKAAKDAS